MLNFLNASDPQCSKLIRDALVKQGGLSVALAKQITFGDDWIAENASIVATELKWNTTAIFRQGLVEIEIFGITNSYSIY